MPATPGQSAAQRGASAARAAVEAAMLGDELARRAVQLKQANDAHESALADAPAVADALIKAAVFLPEDREVLVDELGRPGGAMGVLAEAAGLIAAARQAPPALGDPVARRKSASAGDAPRPRGPGYGPRHYSEHPATLASNARLGGLA